MCGERDGFVMVFFTCGETSVGIVGSLVQKLWVIYFFVGKTSNPLLFHLAASDLDEPQKKVRIPSPLA